MAESLVVHKRNLQSRTKVKTGCATCRIRKVKCDENKPFCQKCVGTGRICDGYESPFRAFKGQPINDAHTGGIKLVAGLQPIRPIIAEITPRDIDLLSRCFSTKTLLDVKLGCDDEATQVLQASLTDPSIRHAVSSLRALREDLETSGEIPASVEQQTSSHNYGLQQYCLALRGLASTLSSLSSNGLKSALLCCQIFISIEQVRANYATMAQHIIQGLRIMHEHRARPNFDHANKLLPAYREQLPLLDVFIIKLFAAPCKFAEPLARTDMSGASVSVSPIPRSQMPTEHRNLPRIAPDMRTELTRIAALTLEFLDKVSRVHMTGHALRLLSERSSLLDSLKSWLDSLEIVRTPGAGPITMSFLRLFHQTLKIILVGTLNSSLDLHTELQTEYDQLRDIASHVGDLVKDHKICSGHANGPRKQSEVC